MKRAVLKNLILKVETTKISLSTALIAALSVPAIFSSCASLNSVSLTPIPSQRSHPVKAEVSKTIFLAFSFDNDFVNPLVDDLKRQCPNGVISGILTKDQTVSYLIVFTRKVEATGFCNTTRTAAQTNSNRKAAPSSDAGDVGADL